MTNLTKAWPYPFFFAHRGGGSHAPENTIAAMRTGQQYSFSAVEFDVKLTADGIAMLMHDDTLERTTNGVGAFKEKSARELETLDAGSWFAPQYRGEKIPRFSTVMQFLHTHGMNADIEIKPCPGRESETGAAAAALTLDLTKDHAVKPLMSSFSIEALRAARAASSTQPLMLLVESYETLHDAIVLDLECVAVCADHLHINSDIVAHLHQLGVRVLVYTVNEVERVVDLQAMRIDGVCTDALDVMSRAFPNLLAAH